MSKLKIFLFLLLICKISFAHENSFAFIENKGQWPSEVLYRTQIPNGYLWICENGLKYQLLDAKQGKKHGLPSSPYSKVNVYKEQTVFFKFPQNSKKSLGKEVLQGKYNFYKGSDPKIWASNVSAYQEITLENIVDKIDFKMYLVNETLKYEYILKPGADINLLKIKIEGADKVNIDGGNLLINTQMGLIKEFQPFTYQIQNKAKKKISSAFKFESNSLSFEVGKYDESQNLVIDPELVFSTYSGSFSDNWAHTSTFDSKGNLYAGGSVFGPNFPVSSGVFQAIPGNSNAGFGGRTDIVIMKYATDGKTLLYSSFLGGNESEVPHSLIVNSKDQLVVMGTTSSANFPVTINAFDRTFNGGIGIDGPPISTDIAFNLGSDLFLTLINENGSAILGSTYLGGTDNDGLHDYRALSIKNYGDEFRGEVYVDETDQIYIASISRSNDYPLKNPIQTKKSIYDAVVSVFKPDLKELVFSTYLGGNDYDAAYGIRAKNNIIYVAGTTVSKDLLVNPNGIIKNQLGDSDGFIIKIENFKITASTYIGTSKADILSLMDTDEAGNIYVFGLTNGTYSVSSGVYQNAKSGQFIHTLNQNLNSTLFSTTIGSGSGSPDLVPTAFMINKCGNIYLSGWGGKVNATNGFNTNSTTKGLPITQNAFQKTTSGSSYYFGILEKNAKSLLFGTYFGSTPPTNLEAERGDHLDGGTCRFDKNGVIYHTACVCKAQGGFVEFPLKNAVSGSHNNSNCNMGAFKFNLDGLKADFDLFSGALKNPESICAPSDIKLTNNSLGAESYEWFLNGTRISSIKDINFGVNQGGKYTFKLKITNKLTCTGADSTEKSFDAKTIDVVFPKDTSICPGGTVNLLAKGGIKYEWSPANLFPVSNTDKVSFKPQNTSTITLKISNEICSVNKEILINVSNDKPDFSTSPSSTICKGDSITLVAANSINSYKWSGTEYKEISPGKILVFPSKNTTYTVEASYSDGCKPIKTINIQIDNSGFLDYGFKATYFCNKPTLFKLENKSSGAKDFEWKINDQPSQKSFELPEFNLSSKLNYAVTLNAKSEKGCKLTSNKTFNLGGSDGLIPNVITPNGDKKNDTFVVGYPETSIEIFNQWGKKVYKTENYLNDWGNKSMLGTYFYILNIKDGPSCKGWLQVLN